MYKALKIKAIGRVQGVGFRPFVYSLANKLDIKGTVQNNMDGVLLIAEGNADNLDRLIHLLQTDHPRIARVDQLETVEIPLNNYTDFKIIESEPAGASSLVIPVDTGVCPECIAEMSDPDNFRYRYPFINCTQCGPRYTIIESLPYDRKRTTMKDFTMCEQCVTEYYDIADRRHHAQPVACEKCGPKVELLNMDGVTVAGLDQAVLETQRLLQDGAIIAIKGIGGYHLACDARNKAVIERLRARKNRPRRPLAVMAANLDIARQICLINDLEADWLESPAAPITVLQQRIQEDLPEELAPGMSTLGVMLPYAPLHHLILDKDSLPILVMTSANPSGLPILYQDDKAISYLQGIADYILTSDREIVHPLDDSVLQVYPSGTCFFRRSRGFVPDPIFTDEIVNNVVALGGQQNNVFAIGRNNQIFLGPHIGDMETKEVVDFFTSEFQHLLKWMGTEPERIAIDLHPLYETRALAKQLKGEIIEVQHHHAHLAACLEENRVDEPSFGLILDGTGYGVDGNIWGFELLYGSASEYQRLGHLKYTALPGGDRAVKEPWRNATGMLITYFGNQGKALARKLFADKSYEIDIIDKMINNGVNTAYVGSCGRLFDAVSALIGVCQQASYDGEAAILLSEMMYRAGKTKHVYDFSITNTDGLYELNISKMLTAIIADSQSGRDNLEISAAFHETIVQASVQLILQAANDNPALNRSVALSGGSFLNRYLAERITEVLEDNDFKVYSHQHIPCGDGGLAYGQLIVAANK